VIRTARDLKTGIIRYGGNFTSGYHWRDGVGPLDERVTMLNQSWGFPEYNEVGTDEFMEFCDQASAPAQICLNLGSGTVQEAHDWVEYCQGGADTPEGKHRAANGHPAPYNVAAWELGNELWGADWEIGWHTAQGYADRYHEVYNAIRSLVPSSTMIFANGGDVDSYHDWNATILAKDAADLSMLSTHYVVDTNDLPQQAASRDYTWGAAFAQPIGVAHGLDGMRAQIDANPTTRGHVKLAYTEWMFGGTENSDFPRFDNLGGAVIAAGWLNMLMRYADFIPVADMTGIIDIAGMHKKHGRVFVTPQFWTLWLYTHFAGDTPVATETQVREYDTRGGPGKLPPTPHVPYLDVLATVDSNRDTLALFVVNRDWKQGIPATIHLQDFASAGEITVRTLTADSILAHNDEESPNTVHPTTAKVNVAGNELRYEFAKHSVTVLEFSPK
jgi:alpha-N-arabinofuranosidase